MIHPRVLFLGDSAAATPWVGIAKKLARACYGLKIANKVYHLGSGVTIRVENTFPIAGKLAGISKVWIEAAAGFGDFLGVVWLPEGLMLTPRSTSAPYGYGFPKRAAGVLVETDGVRSFTGGALINPPYGTKIAEEADEALNQVLINRYANNQYLDQWAALAGVPAKALARTNRRLRATIETKTVDGKKARGLPVVMYWPPFYYPTDPAGDTAYWQTALTDATIKGRWLDEPGLNVWNVNGDYQPIYKKPLNAEFRQFTPDETTGLSTLFSTPLIYEIETEEWFCHWPEELLYDNEGFEMLFSMTNQYRTEVGRKPFIREIRGHATAPRMVLAECQRAQVMYHDNEDLFRQGYKTLEERIYNAGANIYGAGENLQIGIAAGLTISAGEQAATAWRNSPGHYANMIHARFDSPPYCTSHEILGKINGVITDAQSGELTERLSGAFWSQIFHQRKYWVMAGNLQQTTRYGTVSFFSNPSPIGWVYKNVDEILRLHVCYRGRVLVVWPLYDLLMDDYGGVILGAALCLYNNVPHLRVIFYATKESDINFYVYRRPLHNNTEAGWTLECTQAAPAMTLYQNTASFDHEGNTAVLTLINATIDNTATFYFPMADNQFQVFASSVSYWRYTNGAFSVIATYLGPEINYTVETATQGATTYLTRYKQECVEQEIPIYPFYTPDPETGELALNALTVRYSFLVDQTRTGYTDPVATNEYQILETLILPSGKEVVHKTANVAHNEARTALTVAEGAYFLVWLYLDPHYEDLVYLKIAVRGEGTKIYGQATLYADLFDAEAPVVIATYAEQKLNETDLVCPTLYSEWTGAPTKATVASGLISTGIAFARDTANKDHPLFLVPGAGETLWKCLGYTGTYRAYTQKPMTGTHYATLDGALGTGDSCIIVGDKTNFTYAASLKVAVYDQDGIECWATRYKDKFVMQMNVDLDKTPSAWLIPFTQEKTIWANFDLAGMVGMGELDDILPFGAIK